MANVTKVNFETKKIIRDTLVCPEMGDKIPDATIIYKVSRGGKLYITTDLQLSGRGITRASDGRHSANGKKSYFVTELAFKKLQKQHDTCYIELLD
jgi:hypothetical protein